MPVGIAHNIVDINTKSIAQEYILFVVILDQGYDTIPYKLPMCYKSYIDSRMESSNRRFMEDC